MPRDLAIALLGAMRGDVVLRVGEAAQDVPQELLRNFVVRGSAANGLFATTVVEAPLPVRATLDSLEARFQALGWKRPPAPSPVVDRGFVMQGRLTGPSNAFCSGDDIISYSTRARLPNRTQLILISNRASGGMDDRCAGNARGSVRPRMWYEDDVVPRLVAPAGVNISGGGSSGGGDSYSINAQLRGQFRVADLVRHYATQLKEQGWTPVDNANTATAAVQTFSKATTDGKNIFAMFTVVTPPGQSWALLEFAMHRQ